MCIRDRYKESSKKMTIYTEDNFAAEAVEVSVHGERKIKKRYDAERLKRQGGRVEVVLRQENRWKTVRVSGVDAAGNRSEEKMCIRDRGKAAEDFCSSNVKICSG